uniref:Uncharacterized protein n=1 Tax=Nelumbo nucifera TaxID=4432 RepID=A0A822XKU8_NELNU|nr:TPA_asm: hypothetical protein HUJ06_023687 [Nelumbo nucifera]
MTMKRRTVSAYAGVREAQNHSERSTESQRGGARPRTQHFGVAAMTRDFHSSYRTPPKSVDH